MFKRIFLVVLDSFGIGHADDAADFGDTGADTLGSCLTRELKAECLKKLGLFNIERAEKLEHAVKSPAGRYGSAAEKSKGKDTTVGHWEIAGIISEQALPTYPDGFPKEVTDAFKEITGLDVLCNKPYSGTEVIKDYGDEHIRTKKPIVYTSADSVFQIACHENVYGNDELYDMCIKARKMLCGKHAVGRVIARPFAGESGSFYRTGGRHDYSLEPTGVTMLDKLKQQGYDVISVGKINDIFASRGITESNPTKKNPDGEKLLMQMQKREFCGICFVNLVDFDMLYGHRNDIDGYVKALEEFDAVLEEFISGMSSDDIIIITADHGCDPGYPGTDHTRENIPIIAYSPSLRPGNAGHFNGYDCIAKAICDNFGIENSYAERSFLD